MMFFPVFCKSKQGPKAGYAGLFRSTAPAGHNIIYQAILFAFKGIHEPVTFCILLDHLQRLPGMLRHQLIEFLSDDQDFLGLDLDIGRGPAGAT